ncbi:hypothetical protein BXZ70DRAFT_745997 [Cristinia sonorae]|uniref:Uncharacterized protein n=1 Tax=Cristinia sonorae TaxID=1940300 RepID=A0A8K0UF57_9AGAR|nr:hypothetical protein BXZ70DRAFT_745997 [Cristinia sonorae]
MGFFSHTEKLPGNWPSRFHHKCTSKKCTYPNSPQAAEGRYVCLGKVNGSPCKGTYEVSPSDAKAAAGWISREVEREAEQSKKLMAHLQEARRRKDDEHLQLYQNELATYKRVLQADAEGDIRFIRQYIRDIDSVALFEPERWHTHLIHLREEVLRLQRLVRELQLKTMNT